MKTRSTAPLDLLCRDFTKIEAEHSTFIGELRSASKEETLRVLGGLSLIPHFHGNHLRIRCLTHLILRNSEGSQIPSHNHVERWLNQSLSDLPLAAMEDPRTEVFVRRAILPFGDFLLPEGWFAGSVSRLQHLLQATMMVGPKATSQTDIQRDCIAATKLLDRLLTKNGFSPNDVGFDNSKREIPVGRFQSLPDPTLTVDELSSFDLPDNLLERLSLNEPLEGSILINNANVKGVWQSEGNLIIFDPGAIMLWMQRRILEHFQDSQPMKFEQAFSYSLEREIVFESCRRNPTWDYFIDGKRQSKPPKSSSHVSICELGGGNVVVRLTSFIAPWWILQDDLNLNQIPISSPDEKSVIAVEAYLSDRKPEESLIFNVLTDPLLLPQPRPPKIPPNTYHNTISHDQFVGFCQQPELEWVDLKTSIDHALMLEEDGLKIEAYHGLTSIIAYSMANAGFILPENAPFARKEGLDHIVLMEPGLDFTRIGLQCSDWRSAPNLVEKTHYPVCVDREFAEEHPPEKVHRYHPPTLLMREFISEVVFLDNTALWIDGERAKARSSDWRLFALFHKAVSSWLQEIIQSWPSEKRSCNFPAFHFRPTVEDFNIDELAKSPLASGVVIKTRLIETGCVELCLTKIGLRGMMEKGNQVERKLVKALITLVENISTEDLSSQERHKIEQIAHDPSARYLHLGTSQEGRSFAGEEAGNHLLHLREAPKALIAQDFLAKFVRESGFLGQSLETETAKAFLQKCVQKLEGNLLQKCQEFSAEHLVIKALTNSEYIMADRSRYHRTIHSVKALDEEKGEKAQADFRKREIQRTRTGTASRGLIEFAIVACPEEGRKCTDWEFHHLLGIASLIIEIGQLRDSFQYRLRDHALNVTPSGFFGFDDGEQNVIFHEYQTAISGEQYDWSLEEALSDDEPEEEIEEGETPVRKEFATAFEAEFGVSLSDIFTFSAEMNHHQQSSEKLVESVSIDKFKELVSSSCGPISDALLSAFALRTRDDYYELPEQLPASERYLWRYGRWLSLIRRPFIEIHGKVIFAPSLLKDHAEKLVEAFSGGHISEGSCRSAEMKAWLAKRNNEAGSDFEEDAREKLRSAGYRAENATMGLLGKSKDGSDVDIVAWQPESNTIWIIEVKRLKRCLNIAEVGNQFNRFQGSDDKKDKLTKHLNRLKWIEQNPKGLEIFTKVSNPKIKGFVLTNGTTPLRWAPLVAGLSDFVTIDEVLSYLENAGGPTDS
ncbi:MAG: hypothetical protein ABF334_00625 [Akkermansiaceae bacterium]